MIVNMSTIKYLVAAVMLMVGVVTAHAQNADEIIQKHIDAVGGYDKWAKIKSIKMAGSLSVQGMEVQMTQTIVNETGMRMDISVMGINGYTIITPKEGWIFMPLQPGMDKVTPIPSEELNASQEKINIKSLQLVDKSKIAKAEYVGKDSVGKVACHKLKVTDKQGNVQMTFIDAATYYLLRSENTVKIQGEEQELGVTFSDFKKLPEGVTIAMTWSSPQGDINFKSIEINKQYDASIFKPDTEVKK